MAESGQAWNSFKWILYIYPWQKHKLSVPHDTPSAPWSRSKMFYWRKRCQIRWEYFIQGSGLIWGRDIRILNILKQKKKTNRCSIKTIIKLKAWNTNTCHSQFLGRTRLNKSPCVFDKNCIVLPTKFPVPLDTTKSGIDRCKREFRILKCKKKKNWLDAAGNIMLVKESVITCHS